MSICWEPYDAEIRHQMKRQAFAEAHPEPEQATPCACCDAEAETEAGVLTTRQTWSLCAECAGLLQPLLPGEPVPPMRFRSQDCGECRGAGCPQCQFQGSTLRHLPPVRRFA